jgi:uncharacterized protein (TIGR03437 family)
VARNAEIFNPVTGLWRDTAPMNLGRGDYSTLLLPNGKLLVIGGYSSVQNGAAIYAGPPEIFDPATEKWSIINTTGVDLAARYNALLGTQPTAIALPSGKVLLVGGFFAVYPLLFDPATGVVEARSKSPEIKNIVYPKSVLLSVLFDGRVLMKIDQDVLIYDPDNDTWITTNTPKVNDTYLSGTINAMLPDGSVVAILTTVSTRSPTPQPLSYYSAVFDPATQQWGNYVKLDKFEGFPVTLTNGGVLSVNYYDNSSSLYDPKSKTWSPTNPIDRTLSVPVLLADGRVMSGNQFFGNEFESSSLAVAVTTSAASYYVTPLARGSMASVFGSNLSGANLRIVDTAGVDHPISKVLADTPNQVNYIVPDDVPEGQVVMTTVGGGNPVAWFSVSRVSPGLFTADASGRGVPAALALRVKADGSQSYESLTNGIDLGAEGESVFLVLFGTGIRNRTSPLTNSLAYIGGVKTPVLFAGSQGSFAGLDQINVQIPRSLAGRGDVDVLVTVDGKTANPVTLRIK